MLQDLWRRWRERWELRRRIAEELEFHLQEAVEANMASGLSPQAAKDEAAFRLGDRKSIAHQCYQLMADELTEQGSSAGQHAPLPTIAYAAAALLLPPLLAVLLMPHYLRELPLAHPDQFSVSSRGVLRGFDLAHVAPDEAAAFRRAVARIGLPGAKDEAFAGQIVSGNFFELQGVRPLLGTGFVDPDVNEIVISYGLWRKAFRTDPAIVGRLVAVNHVVHRVVGVMPEEYWFLSEDVDFWARALVFRGKEIYTGVLLRPGPGEAAKYLETVDARVKWIPFRDASRMRIRAAMGIVGAALALLGALGLVQMWSLRRVIGKHKHTGWILLRNYLFLFAKALPPLTILAILWLGLRLSTASYFAGVWAVLSTFIFSMLGMAVIWQSLVDQRLRCFICLRKLSMPLPLGVIGSILFDSPGTEYICAYGHGTLYVPSPTSEGLREMDWNPPAGLWAELLQSSPASRS